MPELPISNSDLNSIPQTQETKPTLPTKPSNVAKAPEKKPPSGAVSNHTSTSTPNRPATQTPQYQPPTPTTASSAGNGTWRGVHGCEISEILLVGGLICGILAAIGGAIWYCVWLWKEAEHEVEIYQGLH